MKKNDFINCSEFFKSMNRDVFKWRFENSSIENLTDDESSQNIVYWLGEYLSGNIKGAMSVVLGLDFKTQYVVLSLWMSLFKRRKDIEDLAKIILLFKSEHEFKSFQL